MKFSTSIEMSSIIDLGIPEGPYAIIASFLTDDTDLTIRKHIRQAAGDSKYRYKINQLCMVNGEPEGNPDIIRFVNRSLYYIAWTDSDGELHRLDGPAVIFYDEKLRQCCYLYAVHGWLGNADHNKPSMIKHINYIEEIYFKPMKIYEPDFSSKSYTGIFTGNRSRFIIHRDNNPAIIKYYHNGSIYKKKYYQHGKLQAPNAEDPYEINYRLDGSIETKNYTYRNRQSAVAVAYYPSGEIKKRFFRNHLGWCSRIANYSINQSIESIEFTALQHTAKEIIQNGPTRVIINEYTDDSVFESLGYVVPSSSTVLMLPDNWKQLYRR